MLCYAPTRCRPSYLRYAAVRDVNLTALRYVVEAVRIRLFALCYTTARRAFSYATLPLSIGAAQSKFNHPPLLNGCEILSCGRSAKILNLIAHAADGFAPRRRIAAHKFYLAARKFHGAHFALKFRRRFAADTERSINF